MSNKNKTIETMTNDTQTPDAQILPTPDAQTPDAKPELSEIEIAQNNLDAANLALIAATKNSRAIGADETKTDAEYNAAIAEKQKCEIAQKTAQTVFEKLRKTTEHKTRQTAIVSQLNYLIDADATEKLTDNYKTVFADISEKLRKSVPMDIPMQLTGEQLAKQNAAKTTANVVLPQISNGNLSIREQIYALFDAGMTPDDVANAGQFTRKQANDTRFHWLRKNNLVGITK